ncbi:MAG: ribonuclease III [Spirochaetota bacterium]|nr:ribonuclease III [Spirochaetota bacterium]
MDDKRKRQLSELQESLNIQFQDIDLLNTSFLHSSYVNEQPDCLEDNEKLELLGDSVLAFIVNEYLYKSMPQSKEGELSKIKSIVVSEVSLAEISRRLDLGKYLLLGKGELQADGMNRQAILADTLEALIGAYYLDTNIDSVRDFILGFITEEIDKVRTNKHNKDYKTELQLMVQHKYKNCPTYKTISEEGPDHNKIFHVNVLVNDNVVAAGSGSSKKLAQQDAAKNACDRLGIS